MSQKLFVLSAACALLFLFATANVASAQECAAVAPAACPCVAVCKAPCFNPCVPPVTYRVGLFGVVRPVAFVPAYAPAYYPVRFVRAPYIPYRAYPAYCW